VTTGWICPRCSVVHAPSVLRCDCKPVEKPPVAPDDMMKRLEKNMREKPPLPPLRGILPICPSCGRGAKPFAGAIPLGVTLPGHFPHPRLVGDPE
jgi:hypothetical protein